MRTTVRDFFDDYSALLDAAQFQPWLELFESDATYEVKSRENEEQGLALATMRADSRAMLADRLTALVDTQFFAPRSMRHLVSGVQIVGANGDTVDARASFLVAESLESELTHLHTTGEYRTRLLRSEEGLRIRRMTAVYDGALINTSLIYPL